MAAAEGQQQLATAQAALVRAQAVGPANVTWVSAYSAADLTHVNSRTDAYVTNATDVANGISDYATQEAASLATAISDFGTLHASPGSEDRAAAQRPAAGQRKGKKEEGRHTEF